MELIKYRSISRMGHRSTVDVFHVGQQIRIREKIDGANASFIKDDESDIGVAGFSHRKPISVGMTLNGFSGFLIDEISKKRLSELNPNYRYYGEWLVSHKIRYKEGSYYKFYLFDIIDERTGLYLLDDEVTAEAERLGFLQPELLYSGEYISYDHLLTFVGKSSMSIEKDQGEGIVVKTHYRDKYGTIGVAKMVTDKFREVKLQKAPKDPNRFLMADSAVETVMTKPRVEKLIFKAIDEGIVPSDFCNNEIGIILKTISKDLIDDMYSEESDVFDGIDSEQIVKTVGKKLPLMIKEIIADRISDLNL